MLEAAVDLLRGYGLSGAGINDVVRESGAPRGSLYHFFPGGKEQIACEALALYIPRVEAFLEEALATRRAPAQKVLALFEAFARRVEEGRFARSCPLGTVALDLGEDAHSAAVRALLAEGLVRWKAVIASHLPRRTAAETASFASLIMTAVEGAYVCARAEQSAEPFREAGRWLARLAA